MHSIAGSVVHKVPAVCSKRIGLAPYKVRVVTTVTILSIVATSYKSVIPVPRNCTMTSL